MRLALILGLVFPLALSADRILLKSGETVAGRYLGEEKDGIIVQTMDGNTRRLPASAIEEVKLGLMGMRLCYEVQSRRTCDDQFRAIRKGVLVVVSGPDFESESEVPLSSVQQMEIWPNGRGNLAQDIDLLSARAEITLTSGQQFSGRVERTKEGFNVSGSSGKVRVDARMIDHISLDFRPERNIRVRHFFPGLRRYEMGDRWIGGAEAMLFTAALGVSAYSAYGLNSAAARGKSDPSTWLFYNTSHRSSYTAQMRMWQASSWAAGGIFCLNLLDVFLGPRLPEREGHLTGLNFELAPGRNFDRRASFALHLSFN